MARDQTWLSKLKAQISHKLINPTTTKLAPKSSSKSTHVGVLAFEIAGLLSKLLALHHSLSDAAIVRLKNDVVSGFDGVRKLVSTDETFLLTLAAAEMLHTLRLISAATSTLSRRCSDAALRSFSDCLNHFADAGRDIHGWAAASPKDLDALLRRADRLVAATSALYREMEELTLLENSLKKKSPGRDEKVLDAHQKIAWQKQEVKHVKDKSLWNKSFDSAVLLLARLIFTILARIKLVFGIGHTAAAAVVVLPRSLSTSAASATVFPASSDLTGNPTHHLFVSGPLTRPEPTKGRPPGPGFFESKTKALNTLGAAALALHYANLIIVLEKMIKAPHRVGLDAREDVYSMLPSSIRSALRARLKGVGFSATDPVLAGEWRDALSRILAWLGPLAHNMIKWQSERSFEHHNLMPKSNSVFLLQTLYFANQEKTEAAITELLVGLNYIWRFEREMNAKALGSLAKRRAFDPAESV
ncbi:hypothetical protein Cgig2_010539 [Carnegiea gigantea]|uniref:Uncharacterized protein n=1 Tax=Carnegiea gigantea TaxID=171969 RepID=A0A9Q1KU24_9CARY|nr:hypothetical protein Cgig2_010539 [Carnegiea gigantea]